MLMNLNIVSITAGAGYIAAIEGGQDPATHHSKSSGQRHIDKTHPESKYGIHGDRFTKNA